MVGFKNKNNHGNKRTRAAIDYFHQTPRSFKTHPSIINVPINFDQLAVHMFAFHLSYNRKECGETCKEKHSVAR